MYLLPYITLCVSMTLAYWVNPGGWLDRLVQYHKQKFMDEINEVAPVNIKASIIPKEPGYVDSPDWDYDSVIRLLKLMRASEEARPAMLALRRMLRSTRRFMSKKDTYKYFPSLAKDHPNDFYYDVSESSLEDEPEEKTNETDTSDVLGDDSIIYISNPVEARLPSSRITVRLLKQIMEARGRAARDMPTMKRWTAWPSKTSPTGSTKGEKDDKVPKVNEEEANKVPDQVNDEKANKVPDQVNDEEANFRKAAEDQGLV